ncbi:MAG: glutamine--fructose-6-phosphate transaminase (isomerizing) [Chitinophagales bacterium]
MCGITGYIGNKQAFSFLIEGLKKLEYRGYDSAGVALVSKGELNTYKRKGRVSEMVRYTNNKPVEGNIGIGHTRWATHGEPNHINSHPHCDKEGELAIVHNGIIENYGCLREELRDKGYDCVSETDTEVLVHLIKYIWTTYDCSLEEAVGRALDRVVGSYAIAVACKKESDKLIVAKKNSPLLIGIGEEEFFVASDALPIVQHTDDVVILEDKQMAIMSLKDGLKITNLTGRTLPFCIQKLEIEYETVDKGAYEHFMLKEIFEQPKVVARTMKNRLNLDTNQIYLPELAKIEDKLQDARRIIITACGTSWHSGLVAEYLLESLAEIPVEVEYASEFRYRKPLIFKDDIVIAISQSGETADTLAALELAKSKDATTIGVVNVESSTIARMTDVCLGTKAGPEIGVASTKAFTTQLAVFAMLAMHMGRTREVLSVEQLSELSEELARIPGKISEALTSTIQAEAIAEKLKDSTNALFLGRGINFPIALEGALKLKEISYIHAEGYPAAEMKHGPIALIDENMPVITVANDEDNFEKMMSNILEVKARKGYVVAIASKRAKELRAVVDYVIDVPTTMSVFTPLLNVIPLQLLSYYIADLRECDIDKPRNLAKSVTVE